MLIREIIQKKANKQEHSEQEIAFLIKGIVSGEIPDYLITSWLTAVYINGLSTKEGYYLAKNIKDTGEIIDLSKYNKSPIIDKHSTGGIGDKVTLILSPIVASLDIAVAKVSGRGLGFTGGTIDKLESIGVQTQLTTKQMVGLLNDHKLFVASQTTNITPADKILYNLRDVTGTVKNYGLIASSVLSKKFSITGTHVYLDVKYGSGSFCKNFAEAKQLIHYLKTIAKLMKRKLTIIVSSMQQPLGLAIGNAIEVKESVDFLSGKKPSSDLKELIYKLTSTILRDSNKKITLEKAYSMIDEVISSKKALNKFYEWVKSQKGNLIALKNGSYFKPKYHAEVRSNKSGYLSFKSTDLIGMASNQLGAGRILKTDSIDMHAGILLNKKAGDKVRNKELICTFYSSNPIKKTTIDYFLKNCEFSKQKVKLDPVVKEIISHE